MAGTSGANARRLGNHYLLDSCILIKFLENRELFLKEFKRLQQDYAAVFCISEAVEFEFLRGKILKEQRKAASDLLSAISSYPITLDQPTRGKALTISQIYKLNGVKESQISYIDVLNASLLKKHEERMILMTLDHQDYPTCLLDLVEMRQIEAPKERIIVGYYVFSKTKFDVQEKRLENLTEAQAQQATGQIGR